MVLAATSANGFAAGARTSTIPAPEDFMARIVRLTVSSRNAELWALLHPAHQQLVPRSRFIRCRTEPPGTVPSRVVSSAFQGKRYERIDVPLIPQHTSTAVTLKVVVERGKVREPATVTVHAVWTGLRWAWFLPASSIPAFRAGKCPP